VDALALPQTASSASLRHTARAATLRRAPHCATARHRGHAPTRRRLGRRHDRRQGRRAHPDAGGTQDRFGAFAPRGERRSRCDDARHRARAPSGEWPCANADVGQPQRLDQAFLRLNTGGDFAHSSSSMDSSRLTVLGNPAFIKSSSSSLTVFGGRLSCSRMSRKAEHTTAALRSNT
jgi:hypothetical protein